MANPQVQFALPAVQGDPAVQPIPPRDIIDQVLEWIGFDAAGNVGPANRAAIIDESFETFEELAGNSSKDIESLAYSFNKRTLAQGKFTFGLRLTKRIKSMIRWVLDFHRCSETPTIDGLDRESFLAALEEASRRDDIRVQEADQADIISKQAEPGKFKDERKWND